MLVFHVSRFVKGFLDFKKVQLTFFHLSEPRCGFSNAVVQIMRMHNVPYESYDVLEDEELRQQIKEFTSWPTIPQVREFSEPLRK